MINIPIWTISYFSELIKKGVDIGIDNFVIHPSGEPIEETESAERMECAKESLAELAEIAARSGATIAVEDLPRTCLGRNSAEILELISVHPALRVCFDTNHLLSEDIPIFIRNVGSKIITLHVSDYDFLNERHWLPGEGDINWSDVLAALQEVGYAGPWLYEVGYSSPATIERRILSAQDFVDNAQMIFAGEKPEAIGLRKPDLKFWK
ncbi:MAG: sugar phosphate isomerase/epimerase [Lachnospiraceae bacterium]|nr:sugar phosphate isomerase/epimerase [Lachnospiraceae bacterium]